LLAGVTPLRFNFEQLRVPLRRFTSAPFVARCELVRNVGRRLPHDAERAEPAADARSSLQRDAQTFAQRSAVRLEVRRISLRPVPQDAERIALCVRGEAIELLALTRR